jgi:hypothetical protein
MEKLERGHGSTEQWEFYTTITRCVAVSMIGASSTIWHVYAEVPVLVGIAQPELVSYRSDRFPGFVTARQCKAGHEIFGFTAYSPFGERSFSDLDGAVKATRAFVIGPNLGFPTHEVES